MIPFSPPYIDDDVIAEVVDALKSGWITTGPKTKAFEEQIAKYVQVPQVMAVNSATAGMELMLRWFGVGEGDEVIVPAYTYCATANVVVHCGAKPVMVDVLDDFTIDPEAVEQAISSKTKVIMPVDFAGLPCHYDRLNKIITAKQDLFTPSNEVQKQLGRIFLLADAAHSFGSLYNGKSSALAADASVFSFHAVKNMTTAEGGAVCFNFSGLDNAGLYKQLKVLSLHGQSKDAFSKMQKGSWEYDVVEAGYKYNMPDVLAAIGLAQLKKYDAMLKRRREIIAMYNRHFEGEEWAQLPLLEESGRISSFHLYPLRIKNITEAGRNGVIQKISEDDVAVNVHFKPLPMMSFYKSLGYDTKDYPVTYDNYAREISLPVYYQLSDAEVATVADCVIKGVKSTAFS